MAAVDDPVQRTEEHCAECDRITAHRVEIRLVTSADGTDSAKFSRHPFRVATCNCCGTERRRRAAEA